MNYQLHTSTTYFGSCFGGSDDGFLVHETNKTPELGGPSMKHSFVKNINFTGDQLRLFFMRCSSFMYPWVGEVVRFLLAGSSTSWFGLWCPAHCSVSIPLLASVFVSGFGLGALSVIVWISHPHLPRPDIPAPSGSPPRQPFTPSPRLSAYLYERPWPSPARPD